LAAARAALVRSEIARRSSSATIAIMPTVSRFAYRHVSRRERDSGALQPEEEVRITGEAIELSDHRCRLAHPTLGPLSLVKRFLRPPPRLQREMVASFGAF
jgi:hypothetical protein